MKKILLLLMLSVAAHAQTTIFSEDFSGAIMPAVPSGWSTSLFSSCIAPLGWFVSDTSQELFDYYIPAVPAKNKYAIINDWQWPCDSIATLSSPAFSLSGTAKPYLSFDYYFMDGDNDGNFNPLEQGWINISTDGGFSWTTIDTLRSTSFKWMKKFVNLAAYKGMPTVKVQFYYRDGGFRMYGIELDNIKVFDAAPQDIALVKVTPIDGDAAHDYVQTGMGAHFGGTILNQGTAIVNSFSITYKVGTNAPVTSIISGVSVPPFSYYDFSIPTPYTVATAGKDTVRLWVTLSGDTNSSNDTMSTNIYGITHWPHKNVVFEEATATWCGFCPRGIVYMDSLRKLCDTGVNIVAVHALSRDPMQAENLVTQDYDDFMQHGSTIPHVRKFRGFPSMLVDRNVMDEVDSAFQRYDEFKHSFGLADISAGISNLSASNFDVNVSVKPAMDLQGDYRLQLILTEDYIHKENDSFGQVNDAYSYLGDNRPLSGVGYNFQDSLVVVPASSMYFRFVARYLVPDPAVSPNGVAGSLPPTMTEGTTYNYKFSDIALSPDWNAHNIKATVVLINNANGNIYNSAREYLYPPLIVNSPQENLQLSDLFPDPANNEINVVFFSKQNQQIQLKIYDMVGRTVSTIPWRNPGEGKQKMVVPVQQLQAGVYNLVIESATGSACKRFTITRE